MGEADIMIKAGGSFATLFDGCVCACMVVGVGAWVWTGVHVQAGTGRACWRCRGGAACTCVCAFARACAPPSIAAPLVHVGPPLVTRMPPLWGKRCVAGQATHGITRHRASSCTHCSASAKHQPTARSWWSPSPSLPPPPPLITNPRSQDLNSTAGSLTLTGDPAFAVYQTEVVKANIWNITADGTNATAIDSYVHIVSHVLLPTTNKVNLAGFDGPSAGGGSYSAISAFLTTSSTSNLNADVLGAQALRPAVDPQFPGVIFVPTTTAFDTAAASLGPLNLTAAQTVAVYQAVRAPLACSMCPSITCSCCTAAIAPAAAQSV